MRSILIGMVLVFINFNIDIGEARIGLIPTFLGYILMHRGLWEILEHSEHFRRAMYFVRGMVAYSLVLYILDLAGGAQIHSILLVILGFISAVAALYISYKIVLGVKAIEKAREVELNSEQLMAWWKMKVMFAAMAHIFGLLAYMNPISPIMAIITLVLSMLAYVIFLIVFNRVKNLYYAAGF